MASAGSSYGLSLSVLSSTLSSVSASGSSVYWDCTEFLSMDKSSIYGSPQLVLIEEDLLEMEDEKEEEVVMSNTTVTVDPQPRLPTETMQKTPSYSHNLYLYDETGGGTTGGSPHASSLLLPHVLSTLTPGGGGGAGAPPADAAKMGTFIGVFLPCIQNIFGVILFIRLTWVVGTAGSICAFAIVFMCCCVTMLTAISMSAIATNGVVPGGGSYFMISRSLGPEFGGAVGILFYIGTTLAAAMYIVGAVEILIQYMAPGLSIFGSTSVPENMYNNYRVYGTVLLIIIGSVVSVGVKFVNKFAVVALLCVVLSICAVYAGIFVNIYGNKKLALCLLGDRLLEQTNCTKEVGSPLWVLYCPTIGDEPSNEDRCDEYFDRSEVKTMYGIQGLASGVFWDNMWPSFREQDQLVSKVPEFPDNRQGYNQVIIDITTSFTILVGIFFPSVTGIMAGSNRSGDLRDAQKSIPIGTIGAILATSTVYLSCVILFSGTVEGYLLRDKFGKSVGGRLTVANIAWPNEWVILIGSFLSTIGAGLQSLTGAPRLLQAIAKDGIIPFLDPISVSTARGEPLRALIVTLCICQCGVLLGNVDYLAPLLSMFFLMCYGFVNLACAVQTLLKTPNWRPRFKYYHWIGSCIGLSLCITVMFMTSWYYALLAMTIAGIIYKYIEYRGAEKEWGDGIRGLALSAARYSLLRLEVAPPHTKNWRPQVLILAKLSHDLLPKQRKLFVLASQLKAGKGLVMAASVLQGDFERSSGLIAQAQENLKNLMEEEKVKGFSDVLVSSNSVTEGISAVIQTSGLGGLKPNTVLIGWPSTWRQKGNERVFLSAVKFVSVAKMALLVPKGTQFYPDTTDKVSGVIDIWWIIHDGGLLMLIPFLLKQHRTWNKCKLRIFTVAQVEDNSIQMKKDLTAFLYALRIDAEVEVVEMMTNDISAYTYERTLMMEQRNQMLNEINLNKKRRRSMVEELVSSIGTGSIGSTSPAEDHEPKPSPQSTTCSKVRFVSREASRDDDDGAKKPGDAKPGEENVRRMHTAVKLNEVITAKSAEAKLVIINLPGIPRNQEGESNYMEFIEVLTEGLDRVLMVRGGGREVITIYS